MEYDSAVHPADMKLYRSKFFTPRQRGIWNEENIIAKRLLVEATLAEVQAEMGMIPQKGGRRDPQEGQHEAFFRRALRRALRPQGA